MLTDDGNHRVIVIDYQTKQIIWQYGVTGMAGSGPGQLNQPDGFDLQSLKAPPTYPTASVCAMELQAAASLARSCSRQSMN